MRPFVHRWFDKTYLSISFTDYEERSFPQILIKLFVSLLDSKYDTAHSAS